jgi:copper chaperone
MTDQEWKISGMSCNHCVMALRRELAKVSGLEVKDVKIGSALLAYEPGRVTPDQIVKAVGEAGYSVASHP